MDLGTNIDPKEEVKNYREGVEVVPPGWYPVVITESKLEENSKKTGKVLKLVYEIQEAEKRNLKDFINLVNASQQCQQIGRATLAKIADSIGHTAMLSDSDVLHGRPFEVKAKLKDLVGESGEKIPVNEIVGYRLIKAGSKVKKTSAKSQPPAAESQATDETEEEKAW